MRNEAMVSFPKSSFVFSRVVKVFLSNFIRNWGPYSLFQRRVPYSQVQPNEQSVLVNNWTEQEARGVWQVYLSI